MGQNTLFTAAAVSSQPIQYQWRLNGADLPGKTDSTLSLFCVSLSQSGQVYTVMATNSGGAVISGPALLQVQLPAGQTQPFSWGTDPSGFFQNFNANSYRSSIGAVFPVYVMETNLGGVWGTDTYTDDSSITAAAVHTGFLQKGERGTVRLRISGPQTQYVGSTRNGVTSTSYGSWAGSYQILGTAPTITRHPASQARMVGGTAHFEVAASGSGPLQYQWLFNGNPIVGETRASLSFPVNSESNAGSYVCTVTDAQGPASSVYALLGVLPFTVGAPQTALSPVGNLAIGSMARMVVTGNTNGGTVYGSGAYGTSSDIQRAVVHAGLLAHGETGAVAMVRLPDQPLFRAELANGVSSIAAGSGPAFTFLGRVPLVTAAPLSFALLPGTIAQLGFSAAHPEPYAIQWRRNGVNLDGQTGPTLTVIADAPGTTTKYDALLVVPGNPTVTDTSFVLTVDTASGHIYTVPSPAEAGQYLSTASNLVYVTVTGAATGPSIWGSGIYTIDSNLGIAAVHAGLLLPGQVGQIAAYTLGPWPLYVGSTRNGVTSLSYGAYPGMVLLATGTSSAQARLSMSTAGNLFISGIEGHVCQVWVSPSLLPGSWSVADTVNVSTSPQLWVDPATPQAGTRFYRVVVP